MTIQTIDNIELLENITLDDLIQLDDGNYKSDIHLNNLDIVYFFPKCLTKNGICINKNRNFIDMLFDISNIELNEWVNKVENVITNKIYEKSNEWFSNRVDLKYIKKSLNPLSRKNDNMIIRTYIDVSENILYNVGSYILPVIKIDYLLIKKNCFDIKLNIYKLNIIEDKRDDEIQEIQLVVNDDNPIQIKNHNDIFNKYYEDTLLKANNLRNEAINKYLEAKNIKSKLILDTFDNYELNEINKLYGLDIFSK
jgi:hypothetical protein